MNKKPKSKVGRPRKVIPSVDEIPDFVLSHGAAKKIWKIPAAELSRAKRDGCGAFKGNRIYRDPLLEWLKKNPRPELSNDPDFEDALKNRKLLAVVEMLELKLSVEKGLVVKKDLVEQEWARLWFLIENEAKGLMEKSIFVVFVTRVKSQIK